MMLDQIEARLWADHGADWSGTILAFSSRGARILKQGATTMIERNLEHLRHLALAIAALVASAAAIGVAILPALVQVGPLA